MSDIAIKYKHLEARLHREELSQEEEDYLLDEMDGLWWQMTTEERAAANARTHDDRRGTAQ